MEHAGQDHRKPTGAAWLRGRPWRRASRVRLLSAALCAGSLVFPLACTAASETAPEMPLAFTIEHPTNRLTAGGAAVASLIAARLQGWIMAPRPAAQGSRENNFCCVTTRRRNFRVLRGFRHRCGALTARTFCLGMGLAPIFLTPFGLPPRRMPTSDQSQALGILAVKLVPTPWLVPTPTAFAQADPSPRSSRTGTASAFWIIMTGAHGSAISQGIARGERGNVLLGRLSKPGTDGRLSVYLPRNKPDREENRLRKAGQGDEPI